MDDPTLLSWIERGQNIAALLVAIGVAGEFALGFMAGPARRRVDAAREAEMVRLTTESARASERAANAEKQAGSFQLQIAQANKGAADAVERAAKAEENLGNAKKSAAEANERAANLEKDAALAKLETEKLKQVVAWRIISPSVARVLEQALSKKPGSVNLRYTDGDPEALYLAIQISQILDKAKWKIAPGGLKLANAVAFGIALPDANSPDAITLRSAFTEAKLPYSTAPLPTIGMGISISTIDRAPTLMIGSRLPPSIP